MMLNNEIHTESTTTPSHFWRNPITWRSTNTGMNENVIGTYSHDYSKKAIILHMRQNIIPYGDGRKCLIPEERKKNDYFTDVVNNCMWDIWHNKSGFVFSDSQLKEVIKILPSVNIRWSVKDECYWCWK